MILVPILVFLIVHGAADQGSEYTYSDVIIQEINRYRAKIAKGQIQTINGTLPSSLSMFQLENSEALELYAAINTYGCQTSNFVPTGGSMNFYSTSLRNAPFTSIVGLMMNAVGTWMHGGSQVTYTNQNIKDFANMIYYKSTKAGCSFQECTTMVPPTYAVACVFDSAPELGKPLYIGSGSGTVNGCNDDSDCSNVFAGSMCGPEGLCGFSFPSTTISTPASTTEEEPILYDPCSSTMWTSSAPTTPSSTTSSSIATMTPTTMETTSMTTNYETSTASNGTTSPTMPYLNGINLLRESVAKGQFTAYSADQLLPSSSNMFSLETSESLELYAAINTYGCQTSNFVPTGGSMNFYSYEVTSGEDSTDGITNALGMWAAEATVSDGRVLYTGESIKEFANMFYYKSTKVGCSYRMCTTTAAVACVFNSAPELGRPVYIASTSGAKGCSANSDCSSVFPGALCGSQGLCVFSSS